ncbi:unnamed protein product [Danaus chrysippus]|uniref:(African queen) hypothetical protein n=1 Tax=Danaus chrysippus TaxID=151541 RepID=A0A8J2QBE6_9NEOP|nr:unnamed protein product [Danaus chrysippus]CAG9558017.1 unnamed protein product [Danaus chrysippus]CAG9558019.1 unnamed protein product [Danaus chrysippus]
MKVFAPLLTLLLLLFSLLPVHSSSDSERIGGQRGSDPIIIENSAPILRGALVDQYNGQALIIRFKSPSDIIKDSITNLAFDKMDPKTAQDLCIKIQGATCDEVLIRQFLKVQRSSKGCIIDETQKEQIIGLLGDSAESIYEEARRIVGLLQKRQLAEE